MTATRRDVLRGAGATLALPWLETLAPRGAEPPLRLAYVYVPNGVHVPDWRPAETGPLEVLPPLLEPLARHRGEVGLLSGLTVDKARSNGDGPGDHARSAAAWLTCAQPQKEGGVRVGESADQVAARAVGDATRLRSLQLGGEAGRQSGECDSGYPCVYSNNVSWRAPHAPMVHETSPRLVFDRLFGGGVAHLSPAERAEALARRRSVLDLVRADARALAGRLGARDRQKLDEYLEGVRELERRLDRVEDPAEAPMERPADRVDDFVERVELLYELLALAFATDATRVATFLVANEGSNRAYRELDVHEGHHSLSHHGGDAAKQAAIARINRAHLEAFARFLDRLAAERDGDARLLDRCLVVYGSAIADGNLHDHGDVPTLVAGGAGLLPRGLHLRFPRETPLANLHRALLRRLGVETTRFGDSTGVLEL